MVHPLPWLITFNIVGYITKRELNNCCEVPSICNSLHIELHLICSIICCTLPCHASLNWPCILDCESCNLYVMVVYHVVCFVPVVLLLDSSCFVAIMRIRSTMLGSSSAVHLLHGLVLLSSRISGKMTVTLDLTTIFAMLVVSMLSLCRATYHLFIKPPKLP